jgi:hypothetical protein
MTSVLNAVLPALEEYATVEDMDSGAWAFVVVASLLIIVVLGWFSLRKQLRKVDFEDDNADETNSDADPS